MRPFGTLVALSWLCVFCPSQQQVFLDARKTPMPLQMAETKALYPAHLDADGLPDIVVANRGGGLAYPSNSSWILLSLGHGRLVNVTPPDRNHVRFALAVADLDGDGDKDVLFTNEITGSLGVGVNDGNGGITWVENVIASGAVTAVAADLDGDGDADVCTGSRLYLNQGNLVFADITATHLPGPLPPRPPALATGDVDGDGDADLMLGDPGGQDRLWRNDGSARFADVTATNMPASTASTRALCLADLDGDGDLDGLRACAGVPLSYYRNDGNGVFSLQPIDGGTRDATSVAAADVDGDGDLDLAFGLESGGILVANDGTAFRVTSGPWEPGPEPCSAVAFADLDGDGDQDLLHGGALAPGSLNPTSQPSGIENRLFFNDGSGRFPRMPLHALPIAFEEPMVAGGDFDGDGDLDVLYSGSGGGALLINDGFGAFSSRPLSLPVAGKPVVGDVDGDGDLDAVLVQAAGSFHVLDNIGSGGLQVRATHTIANLPAYATLEAGALGDVDGDGDPDLVLVTTGEVNGYARPANDALWLNDGIGTFTDGSHLLPPIGTTATDVALGDLDGDADVDIATTGDSIYFNDGSSFRAGPFRIAWNYGESHIALGDLDGDGDLDVAVGNACRGLGCAPSNAGGWDVLHWNDGTGAFGSGQVLETQSSMATGVAVADVDGDGDLDVVIPHIGVSGTGHDNPAENTLFLNDGGRAFRKATPGELPLDFDDTLGVVLGDVDGDGDADLVLCNRSLGGNGTLRGKVHAGLVRHLEAPYFARLGTPYVLHVHGASSGAGLYASFGRARIPVPPLGLVGLDPTTLLLVTFVPAPSTGARAELVLPVPALPGLAGLDLHLQALVYGVDLPSSRLTNRVSETLRAW